MKLGYIVLLCTLFLATQIANSQAQFEYYPINHTNTIPAATIPGTILALSASGSKSTCSASFIILTDSTTECLVFADAVGTVQSSVCDPLVAGATSISCAAFNCYVANPVSGEIVVISPYDGTVLANFAGVSQPAFITVYEDDSTYAFIFLVDASTNSLWYFKVNYNNFGLGPEETVNLFTSTATTAPAGLAYLVPDTFTDRGTIYLSFVGDTEISSYSFVGSLGVPPEFTFDVNYSGGFTSIEYLYMDHYSRLFVYDAGFNSVRMLDTRSNLHETFTEIAEHPTYIATTRNNIFLVVGGDIKVYNEPIQVYVTVRDKLCDDRLGFLTLVHSGGALPINYYMAPDKRWTSTSTLFYPNVTSYWSNLEVVKPLYTLLVFEDVGIASVITPYPPPEIVDSSVIEPNSGDYSLQFYFDPSEGITIRCDDDCYSGRFKAMEFYYNPGAGNQSFVMDFLYYDDIIYTNVIVASFTIMDGDYPYHNWTKISIPMSFGYDAFYIIFTPINGLIDNPIYIDDWKFIPEEYSPVRTVYVRDFCGTKVKSPDIIVTADRALSVTLQARDATCSPLLRSTNDILSSDGTVTATVTNGEAPFEYYWDIPNTNSTEQVTGLEALTTYITIYDNELKSGWFDSSIIPSRSFNATAEYHSPPHSISLLQPKNGNGLYLKLTARNPIDVTTDSVLTFWVHGGSTGGQEMQLVLKLFSIDLEGSNLATLLGVKSILPNVWMQATYRPSFDFTFKSIVIIEQCSKHGYGCPNTAYFDDFVLALKPALKVIDSTGCSSRFANLRITAPSTIKVDTVPTHAKCYNSSTGTIALDVAGGVAPYVIEYSAGNQPKTRATLVLSEISALAESQVSINVTDTNGCVATRVIETILQPPPLSLKLSLEPVKCYAGLSTLSSTMSGGIAPYTYTWSSTSAIKQTPQPAPTPVFTDELADMYMISTNVKINCLGTGSQIALAYPPTHGGYCSLFPTFSTARPSMTITCPSVAPSEFSGVGMWIFIEKSADVDKLSISLAKNGVSASTPVSLTLLAKITAGAWNRIFYNASNTTLSDPQPNQIVITSSSPSSMGVIIIDDVVLIPVTATSVGVVVYSGFNSIVTGSAGQYFLTVVDGNGCSFLKQINVEQPTQISVTANITGATSANATDGSISAFASGGTPPYTYFWKTTNKPGSEAVGLTYGAYVVQVTDANGCIFAETFDVPVEEVKALRAFASGLSVGLGVFVGVAVILGIFSVVMMAIFWPSYSQFGVLYSLIINIGVLMSYAAVLTLLPRPTDALCTAFPWLLGIAFCMVYSCLFIKIWSVYKTWTKAMDPNTGIRAGQILKTLAMVLVVELAVLVSWTASDPPKVERVEVVNNELQDQCRTDTPTFWAIFIALKGAWLLVGAVLSIISRESLKERDSSNVSYATYNFLLLLLLGIPLGLLLGKVPSARMVICLILPVIAFTSTLFIMFFKTWHSTFFHDDIKFPSNAVGPSSHSTGSAGSRGTASTFSASTRSQAHSASAY